MTKMYFHIILSKWLTIYIRQLTKEQWKAHIENTQKISAYKETTSKDKITQVQKIMNSGKEQKYLLIAGIFFVKLQQYSAVSRSPILPHYQRQSQPVLPEPL